MTLVMSAKFTVDEEKMEKYSNNMVVTMVDDATMDSDLVSLDRADMPAEDRYMINLVVNLARLRGFRKNLGRFLHC